jgi:DNA-binding IclR family transcriptional regulator
MSQKVQTTRSSALQSLENALRLIELFRENEELGVTQIAAELKVSKSTAFRLLYTLSKWHYVRQNEDTDRYRLGMQFAFWGDLVNTRNEIVALIHPYLLRLTDEVKEVSYLTILEEDLYVRFIDRVTFSTLLNYGSMIGNRRPAYCTASGKAILAFLPPEKLDDCLRRIKLKRITDTTITTKQRLREALAEIRRNGYSADDEESDAGLSCFATPIIGMNGYPVAAISMSGPTGRIIIDKEEKIRLLKRTAKQIMEKML